MKQIQLYFNNKIFLKAEKVIMWINVDWNLYNPIQILGFCYWSFGIFQKKKNKTNEINIWLQEFL